VADVMDGPPVTVDDGDAEYQGAIERAGKLLARGPRTEHQLRQRLEGAGIEPAVVERALTRLRDLGLVDDLAYARRWIEERTLRTGRGAEALLAELEAKGVDRDTAEKAMGEVGLDEAALARNWAIRLLNKVQDRPLAEQGARLRTMLLRRGFSEEAARAGALAVLPPEGWD
jgi:regulatory protein